LDDRNRHRIDVLPPGTTQALLSELEMKPKRWPGLGSWVLYFTLANADILQLACTRPSHCLAPTEESGGKDDGYIGVTYSHQRAIPPTRKKPETVYQSWASKPVGR